MGSTRLAVAVAVALFMPTATAAQTTGPMAAPAPVVAVDAVRGDVAPPEAPAHVTDGSGADMPLPLDPFRRCATKALRGDFGTLRPWRQAAYAWGLATGVTCCGVAKVTSYGHKWEPAWLAGGTQTASGSRVHLGGCASNPEIPFGTLIWTPYGLRYVTDRGGWVKVGYARVYGRMKRVTNARETANLDYYTWRPMATLRSAPWAIVKRQTDRATWFRPMSVKGEGTP